MTIGSNIRKCRNEKGLTQKDVAAKANISRSYFADVESGRYNPSLDVLKSIANALGTTAQQLLKDDMDKKDFIDETEEKYNAILERIKKISPSDREKLLKVLDIFEQKHN